MTASESEILSILETPNGKLDIDHFDVSLVGDALKHYVDYLQFEHGGATETKGMDYKAFQQKIGDAGYQAFQRANNALLELKLIERFLTLDNAQVIQLTPKGLKLVKKLGEIESLLEAI